MCLISHVREETDLHVQPEPMQAGLMELWPAWLLNDL